MHNVHKDFVGDTVLRPASDRNKDFKTELYSRSINLTLCQIKINESVWPVFVYIFSVQVLQQHSETFRFSYQMN